MRQHNGDTPGNIRKRFKRQKITGTIKATNIKWLKTLEDVRNTCAYMAKTEKHKSKDKNDKVTRIWRAKHNIPAYYTRGDALLVSPPRPEGDVKLMHLQGPHPHPQGVGP